MKISVTNEKEPFGLTVEAGTYSPSYETLSGSIVTFSDAWVGSKIYPNASIVPVQSLNGQSSPYPASGGVNKFDYTQATAAPDAYDLHMSIDASGYFTISGTYNNSQTNQPQFRLTTDAYPLALADSSYVALDCNADATAHIQRLVATNANGTGIAIRLKSVTAGTSYNIKFRVVRYVGSTVPSAWSPYSNICPITGYSSVDVSRCGKNLFDKSAITENKWFNDTNGTITNATGYNLSDYISVKAGETYYHSASGSLRGLCFDVNKNLLSPGSWNANFTDAGTFTVPEGCHYIRITVTTGNVDSMTVNYPSTDTSYHPYNGITKTISLGSTIYGGILNVDSGVLTVTKVKHTVASGDSTSLFQTGDNANRVGIPVSDAVAGTDAATRLLPICNIAQASSTVPFSAETQALGYCALYNKIILVCVPTTATDADSAKSWLVSQGCEFVYPLATPTTIQLTGEEITALLGENNVWASSGDVEVTYRKGGA